MCANDKNYPESFRFGIGPDLLKLRYFVAIAEAGSGSKAAELLQDSFEHTVEQPALNKAFRSMQDELKGMKIDGVPLTPLIRYKPTFHLTPGGLKFLHWARRMLASYDEFFWNLEGGDVGNGTKLRIGLPSIGSGTLLAGLFSTYKRRHPKVNIQLIQRGSRELERLLRLGELDFATSLLRNEVDFNFQMLCQEPIDLLVSKKHRFAGRKQIELEAIKGEDFISYPQEFVINEVIDKAFESFGSSPKIVAEAEVDFGIELVKANMGVAMMPRRIAEKKQGTCLIAIVKPVVEWKIGLIWRRDISLSPHAEAWRKLAEEWTRDHSVKFKKD